MQVEITAVQKRCILILLFFCPFLLGMGIDLYVPSLPAITLCFGVSAHLVQLTIAFYMLGYAGGQFLLGVLSDSLGRRNILVICALLFTVVSFVAALSPSIYFLIVCRLLQGIFIAGPAVVARAIAADCFKGVAFARTVAYISTSWALGPIIGPFIGGYLQHFFGWRADFYFFGIYGLLVFAYAALMLPETHLERASLHPVKLYRMIKAVITHPSFLAYTLISSFIYGVLVVFNVIAPFLIQVNLQYSVIAYGRVALFLGVGCFLGNFTTRLIVHYVDMMKLIFFGLMLGLVMSGIMLLLGLFMKPNLYILIVPVFLLFYTAGLTIANTVTKSLSLFPKSAGTASAISGSGVAIGVFILSSFAATLQMHNQVSLAAMYFIMFMVSLAVLFVCWRFLK